MADLVILSPKQIERLQQKDKIVEDSLAPIAKLEFGVIIRKGAPKPDVGTVHALKQTLMSTKSIASGDPGSSARGRPEGIARDQEHGRRERRSLALCPRRPHQARAAAPRVPHCRRRSGAR